jgi:DNA-binding transcriptional regulator YiaG
LPARAGQTLSNGSIRDEQRAMTGEDLKHWRQQAGLTQRQLAELLDVPPLTISAWETQRLKIQRPRMLALRTVAADLAK